jgi:hypothetical protein
MIEAGFLLLLFISYLVTLFMIMIASGQEPQFAIGILIIFGWAFAVPSIAYLLAADFVSKRFSCWC